MLLNVWATCVCITERSEEDPYDVASELTDMMHDISVLAKINQMISTLKLSYPVSITPSNSHIL